MRLELPKKWIHNLKTLDVAFQPIINIHTGKIFAVEALLRNYEKVGFNSIFDLFDAVYKDNLLYSFDLKLRKKAFKKFTTINAHENIKLFYNLDNRLLEMPNFKHGNTGKLLKHYDICKNSICFEISERHEISNSSRMQEVLEHYKSENFCIAIDDFGVGYSGYKLLYESKPDIIKIDRFFLSDIQKDEKKKLMARSITHLAIQLGIKVIAEGIENKEELLTCRDIGCHFVQGYFIQKPTLLASEIAQEYPHVLNILNSEKRVTESSYKIETFLNKTPPFSIDTEIKNIVKHFQKNPQAETVTIVNSNNEPMGILQENKIKEFIYSPYGRSLLTNNAAKRSKLVNLIEPCGTTEINCNISTIIELFSNNSESIGIILTNNSKYYGFLSARAIITIMSEQNIIHAREQNPLTKLPGNSMIEKLISEIIESEKTYILCYFDLDNFKAFNDVYGFRNGDRAIMLFADILRKNLPTEFFKGHIGGDDFFVAVESTKENEEKYTEALSKIVQKFEYDTRELYSKEDKEKNYIISTDREGNKKRFPLLCVSASVLVVRSNANRRNADYINNILSLQKKVAKQESSHISISCLL
ncbi:GGDEF domain-containing protein [Sulfurimonas xiamenensis]|uniref:GGDEF domain-containing protein n=1 Tax=Sulfurimonas xiamenensis TaxID=2590021 RepID=A0AAJ4A4F0_9BACT|nr:GGDEF domain-containing protein [Sulfurimonas xiamenensis]QFR43711.1 GGDEF domain-containing protein [Sulfurimonas xiamenensis]